MIAALLPVEVETVTVGNELYPAPFCKTFIFLIEPLSPLVKVLGSSCISVSSSYNILSVVPTVSSNLKSNISNCSWINLKLLSLPKPASNVVEVVSNVNASSEKSITSVSNNTSPDKSVGCDCCLA